MVADCLHSETACATLLLASLLALGRHTLRFVTSSRVVASGLTPLAGSTRHYVTQEPSRQYLSRERTGNGGPRQRRRRRERDLRRGRRPDVEELVEDLGRRRLVERVVEEALQQKRLDRQIIHIQVPEAVLPPPHARPRPLGVDEEHRDEYKSAVSMLEQLEEKAVPLSRKDSSGFSAEVRPVLAYARDNRLE